MIRVKIERLVGSRVLILGFLLAALMAVSLMLTSKPAQADTTFTVTRTDDAKDPNLGDGECGYFSARGGRACSLRAAIEQANATPGADTINFGIGGTGVKTIAPAKQLPVITEAVTIDGYSQPGASPNTLAAGTNAVLNIQLDGNSAGTTADGLVIGTSNVVVKGLVINRFENSGIALASSSSLISDVRIEGNFIGTDASGTLDRGNGRFGGVFIGGFVNGVNTRGDSNTIGGSSRFQRNIISGNDANGIVILSTDNNEVQGNLIGTARDGVSPLGNNLEGVDVGSSDNFIGDFSSSGANTIAFNGAEGVEIRESTLTGGEVSGNRILSNSIFDNGRLGINLQGGTENVAGATANDTKDPDTGANDLQNKPMITSATTSGETTTIQAKLNSTPSDAFFVQFFSNPSGNEGKRLIGSKSVTTNSNGNVTFTFIPSQAVAANQNVTATALDVVNGNTSEFSGPRTIVAQ